MSIKDTKDFIKKAIEGGWNWKGVCMKFELGGWFHLTKEPYFQYILLKPEVWQAVGRVEGWEGKTYAGGYDVDEDGEVTLSKSEIWHVKMNGLTPALIEGKTTDEYLKTL